jgi:hypothetical protein
MTKSLIATLREQASECRYQGQEARQHNGPMMTNEYFAKREARMAKLLEAASKRLEQYHDRTLYETEKI